MRHVLAIAVASVTAATAGGALLLALPSSAAPKAATARPAAVVADHSKLPSATFLPLRIAQKAAQVALADCARKGQQVAATVVDAEGVVIAQLRNDGTTQAALDASKGKAYASAGFRSPTSGLTANEPSNPGLLQVPGFVILPGGLPIRSAGKVVGGIGVGGAPSGLIDETCAQAALDSIAGSL
jgi:uncharacterized protein GlcG (DUF336 family)